MFTGRFPAEQESSAAITMDPRDERQVQKYLKVLFDERPEQNIFLKETGYAVQNDQSGEYQEYRLTHSLIARLKTNKRCYEVVDGDVSKEGSITKYRVLGKIDIFLDGKYHFTPCDYHVTKTSCLDPTNLSQVDSHFLGNFLLRAYKEMKLLYFPADKKLFRFDQGNQREVFYLDLKYNILRRLSMRDVNNPVRYEVFDSSSPKTGIFGKVFNVLATLVPQKSGELLAKSKSPRVIKRTGSSEEKVNREHGFALRVGLRSKLPVFANGKGFLVEQRQSGETLEDLLERDGKPSLFKTDFRLRLSIALLRALHDQFHLKGVIHRDIKADNIMVDDRNPLFPVVRFIDPGLSKRMDEDDRKVPGGALLYRAPEIGERKGSSRKSDIFTLGIMISLVWRAEEFTATTEEEATAKVEINVFNHDYQFIGRHLFKGIFDFNVPRNHEGRIRALLHRMVQCDPKKRPELHEAAEKLEQILLERMIEANRSLEQALNAAHSQARILDKECRDKKLRPSFNEYLPETQKNFTEALNQLLDHPLIIQHFVAILRMPVFYGITKREDLQVAMTNIVKKHQEIEENLQCFSDELVEFGNKIKGDGRNCSEKLAALDKEYKQMMGDYHPFTLGIVDLPLLNDKLSGRLSKLQERLEGLQAEGEKRLSDTLVASTQFCL